LSVIAISRQLPANLTPKKLIGGIVKIAFVVVALVLAISHCATAQQATGSVCVAARVDDPLWKQPAILPNGEINSFGFRVKIDKRPAAAWPERKSLKIDGLATSERHLRSYSIQMANRSSPSGSSFQITKAPNCAWPMTDTRVLACKRRREEPLGVSATEVTDVCQME
jgi:hypothetical protein